MICKECISKLYYTYKYKGGNVILTDEYGHTNTVSYDEWLDQYMIIDKLRNELTEYEIASNKDNRIMTAIITCTNGDFQYLDEWIQYHTKIGIDLIYIAYNGPSEYISKLPKYDNVRYLDLSYVIGDKNFDQLMLGSKYSKGKKAFGGVTIQSKLCNILKDIILDFYKNINFIIHIDIDEFIEVPCSPTIGNFLSLSFPKDVPAMQILFEFYGDNGHIYNDRRPVIERFKSKNNKYIPNYSNQQRYGKTIVNTKHPLVQSKEVSFIDAHRTNVQKYKDRFEPYRISLAHYKSKSLEEYISKMNTTVNSQNFDIFKGKILFNYFYGDTKNKVTKEKLQAIPGLLKKYNIDYDPATQEIDDELRRAYIEVNNESYETV